MQQVKFSSVADLHNNHGKYPCYVEGTRYETEEEAIEAGVEAPVTSMDEAQELLVEQEGELAALEAKNAEQSKEMTAMKKEMAALQKKLDAQEK